MRAPRLAADVPEWVDAYPDVKAQVFYLVVAHFTWLQPLAILTPCLCVQKKNMFTKGRQESRVSCGFWYTIFSRFQTLLQNNPKRLITDDLPVVPPGKAAHRGLFIVFSWNRLSSPVLQVISYTSGGKVSRPDLTLLVRDYSFNPGFWSP